MRRLQLVRGACQLDRRMALGTRCPRPRERKLGSAQLFMRRRRLSASGKRDQNQRAGDQASRDAPPRSLTHHVVCSPPPMSR
jgi:hypothetical protein